MKEIVIYVHGKGGSAAEAGHYRPLFPDAEVVGFDYRAQSPWEAEAEFPPFFAAQRKRCDRLTLIANSIGAFFSMSALDAVLVDRAYLISPVVDMEKLIVDMLQRAGVREQELAEKQEIPTAFGETLSWKYLTYVRAHPIAWHVPTRIWDGAHDDLTAPKTISAFARRVGAELTVYLGEFPFWLNALYVAIGELGVLLVPGTALFFAFSARGLKNRLFPEEKE